MKWLLLIAVLWTSVQGHASEKNYLFDTVQKGFVKLLAYKNDNYVITSNRLYRIGRQALELKAVLPFSCNDACVYQNGFAFATDIGLVTYTLPYGRLKKLLPDQIARPVNHVVLDARQQLWFSFPYEGAYMLQGDQARLQVQAPALYALAATPDSNVWVGTNLGMYKVPVSGVAQRYAEEGLEGFELPDNIVEHLFTDVASNVWALLPDQMAFIAGGNDQHDVPSYRYPEGSATIFSILKLPVSATSYLFTTDRGLVYTSGMNAAEGSHTGEIHQSFRETAYLLPDTAIERPAELVGSPVISVTTLGSTTWFVTNKGIWSMPTKKLIKRLTALTAT